MRPNGVSSDTPIREIVDSCRVWESHADRELSSDAGQDLDSVGESDDTRKLGCLRTDLQELLGCSEMDPRVPVSGVGVGPRSVETPRKVGEEDGQLAPLQAIASLVTRLLRSAQEGQLVDEKAPSEGEPGPLSAVSSGDWRGKRPPGKGVGEGVFLVWTPRTWSELMFTSGHFFSVSATGVVGGGPEWPISGLTD